MNGFYFFSPYLFPALPSAKQEEEEDHGHRGRFALEARNHEQDTVMGKMCSILCDIVPHAKVNPQAFTIFQFGNPTVRVPLLEDAYKLPLPSSSSPHLHRPLDLPFYPLADAPEVL